MIQLWMNLNKLEEDTVGELEKYYVCLRYRAIRLENLVRLKSHNLQDL